MDKAEQAKKAALESYNRILTLLCQPRDQAQYRNLIVETGEAVIQFKTVVSLLGNSCLGQGRVRKLNATPPIQRTHPKNKIDGKKHIQTPQTAFENVTILIEGKHGK